jgi:hypothetical protein
MTRYDTVIRGRIDGSKTLSEAATKLESYARYLRGMEEDGLWLRDEARWGIGFVETDNKELAEKWGLKEGGMKSIPGYEHFEEEEDER